MKGATEEEPKEPVLWCMQVCDLGNNNVVA